MEGLLVVHRVPDCFVDLFAAPPLRTGRLPPADGRDADGREAEAGLADGFRPGFDAAYVSKSCTANHVLRQPWASVITHVIMKPDAVIGTGCRCGQHRVQYMHMAVQAVTWSCVL